MTSNCYLLIRTDQTNQHIELQLKIIFGFIQTKTSTKTNCKHQATSNQGQAEVPSR